MSVKKIVLSIVTSAVVGSILGILYAPDNGKSTRRKIINKGKGYMTNLENMMENYANEFNEKIENLKVEFTELGHNGKSGIEDFKKEAMQNKPK